MAAGVLALTCGGFAQGTTLYVDVDALPGGNGGSWATAFQHLNDALDEARTLPGLVEVLVADGEYTPNLRAGQPVTYDRAATFEVPAGIVLRGGVLGGTTTLTGDLEANDLPYGFYDYGDNSYHVVTVVGSSPETVIDGVTIVGGNAFDAPWPAAGGGIFVADWGGVTITACRFERNLAANGGGLGAISTDAVITDSVFVGNAALYGGAVDSGGGGDPVSYVFIGVSFEENTAFYRGGAYYAGYEISSELVNCRFRGNQAEEGGAIYNDYNLPMILTNCDFAGNSALWRGGALSCSDTGLRIANATVAGNYAFEGGGFYLGDDAYSDSVTFKNSILYHNAASVGSQIAMGPGDWGGDGLGLFVNLDDVDLQGNCAGISAPAGWLTTVTCTDVFEADPRFVSVGSTPAGWMAADLELKETSPCIDAAKNTLVADQDVFDLDGDGITNERTPMDLIGARRIVGEVDHGAYETQTCHWDLSGDAAVSFDDVTLLVPFWGTTAWPEDLDGNGLVGFGDLTGMLSKWGPCP